MNNTIINQIITEEVLEANTAALESIKCYKKTKQLIDETYSALGKKQAPITTNASTVNFEINTHGTNLSVTAQKI